VLALRRAGYKADGFECNPALVRASAAIFALSFFTRVGSAPLRHVCAGWQE